MSTEILALVISGVMLLLSVVTFIINSVRTSKKDVVNSESRLNDINQSLLKANLKLDQVCTIISDMRTDVKAMQNKQMEHTEQIARLEQSVATAFLRIDELREQLKGIPGNK